MPGTPPIDVIRDIIGEVIGREADTIEPAQRLVEDLGVDSLAMIEIVIGVEQQLGVAVPDDEVAGLTTVTGLASYVESPVGQTT
ncbi:MAG: acyl carrier protein [Nocardioidaceae bacterium]|nr:acyl carrier protein [Nocardioidaceae bacterium]MCL2611861.1 acyl carrier protein [Nocardioidaceae bacterium]